MRRASSHKPQTKLSQYNGSEINLRCQYTYSSWQTLAFYIVESEGPAILGLNSCNVMDIFSLRFNDIGIDICAKHVSKSTSNVIWVTHSERNYPIQLRQDIKDELTQMEAMGVITKVTGCQVSRSHRSV
jgi:hypothetical protein